MIHKFTVRSVGETEPDVAQLRVALGLTDLEVSHDYAIEFENDLTDSDIELLCEALSDGVTTVTEHNSPLERDAVLVAYRRNVVDNESASIVAMCELLGLRATAAKMALRYRSAAPQLVEIIRAKRYNSNIEEIHTVEPVYQTLALAGGYQPAQRFDLRDADDGTLAGHGTGGGRNLSLEQMRQIRDMQVTLDQPYVTDVLLEALDARWSDHCAHTTWKSLGRLLSRLIEAAKATGNPNILSMFHDNAGVWDFYAGQALAIKAETHNGPSAISAYFGQLTKLGGVLRDVLGTGLGADPIGSYEYTATGLPEQPAPIAGRPAPRQIATDTIRAIKEYGNTFGVPMMWSHMTFHPGYRAKPFALGGSVGLLPTSAAQRGLPQPGDLVVLIGGPTGSEGIHGASASSAGSTMDEAAVQIGAPLEQVKFRKAIVDLRDAGCLRAITDLGAAGLNSAVGEMGEACGVWINTALVPLKTSALPMWRILLSESQERMLLAVPAEHDAAAREILDRHEVRTTVIGRFTGTGRYCVFHQPELDEAAVVALTPDTVPADLGELGFDVPYSLLDTSCEQIAVGAPPATPAASDAWPEFGHDDLAKLLQTVIGDAEIASQRYADSQYDSTVQGNTFHGPLYGRYAKVPSGYWAGTPVDGCPGAAVLSTAFNPWLFDVDPVKALRQMFFSVVGGQVLAGVALNDICVCDNFYTPHLSDNWQEWLVAMVDELADLVRRFGVPVISGKDSSAGSTKTDEGVLSVPPAVFFTAMGKVPHTDRLTAEQWTAPGNLLVRIGPATPATAATVAARSAGFDSAGLDEVTSEQMLAYLAALETARTRFRSATRIGAGGVLAQLVTGSFASGLGVDLADGATDTASLFAEHRCGAIVEIDPADLDGLPAELSAQPIGTLSESRGVRRGGVELVTAAVEESWNQSFAARIA